MVQALTWNGHQGSEPRSLDGFTVGDTVLCTAKDDFWAFIDGWRLTVEGFQDGLVRCIRYDEGVKKTFYIQANQLCHTI